MLTFWDLPKNGVEFDWLICTVLSRPSMVRPSIKQFNGMRSEDDITHAIDI